VLETLCGTFQLPRERFSVVGRAETLPVDTNSTPEGRARNRRVDVVIVNSLRIQNAGSTQTAARK
jgi:chemotaxis protein MotB